MRQTSINDCKLIDLRKISDPRGNLTVIEERADIPFDIKRVYYLYDVPGGATRGGHAYYNSEELIIALSGSFNVVLDSGDGERQTYHLNRSYYGLLVPKMIWREMENFSTNSLALIVSSTVYNANDYIRNYDDFKKMKYNVYLP